MDIDPEKRNGLLETAALAGAQEIGGLTLRPMTAATWSLHQRVKAAAGNQDGEDWSLNLFAFVFLHSQPEAKLRGAFARPAALLPEIYDFMSSRQVADAMLFKGWMESQMEQFHASLTKADPLAPDFNDPKA